VQKIDIFGVRVACTYSAHSTLSAEDFSIHNFTIYKLTNGYHEEQLLSGELHYSLSTGEWTSLGINISTLSEGDYYVSCHFEHSCGSNTSRHILGDSSEFSMDHILNIATPEVIYTGGRTQTIDIKNITIVCSNPHHGILGEDEVSTYTYKIYELTDISPLEPLLQGELHYSAVEAKWSALSINISSLPEGEYYVVCHIEHICDSRISVHAPGDTSEFSVDHVLTITSPQVNYIGGETQTIDIAEVVVYCSYLSHGTLNASSIQTSKFVIYKIGISSPFLEGTLAPYTIGNITEWHAINVDVSALPEGTFYIICYFEHECADGASVYTPGDASEFTVEHAPPTQYDMDEQEPRKLKYGPSALFILICIIISCFCICAAIILIKYRRKHRKTH
jgi:hypothetical protein